MYNNWSLSELSLIITDIELMFKANELILENFPCEDFRPLQGLEPTTSKQNLTNGNFCL